MYLLPIVAPHLAGWQEAVVDGTMLCVLVCPLFWFLIGRHNLADSHRQCLLRAIEGTADCVVITDADGRIRWVNAAFVRTTGYSLEDAIGKTPGELLEPGHGLNLDAQMWQSILAGQVWKGEMINRRKDGSLSTGELIVSPVQDTRGKITHFIAVARDITDRKRMEQQLEEANERLMESLERANELASVAESANRAKSAFLASMSHEIRTPMNGIMGMAELLMDTPLNAEQRDYLQTLKNSANGLLTLLNDILDFSKIEAGKLNLEQCPFDLLEVVEEVAQLFARGAREKEVELMVDFPPTLPSSFQGDPTRIRQILSNFVNNALKFTHEGEIRIEVSLCSSGCSSSHKEGDQGQESNPTWLRLTVHDTGIGISEEQQARIFEAFTQADISTTRRYGGTGLGLSISKKLAELMGGRIGVQSKEGEGSSFWVEIPLLPHGVSCANEIEDCRNAAVPDQRDGVAGTTLSPAQSSTPAESSPQAQTTNGRILVVDDHPVNRRILYEILTAWGFDVERAEDGARAMQKLAQSDEHPFALILADHHMPRMDGAQLAQTLHGDPRWATIPFLLLSSTGSEWTYAEQQAMGIKQVLTKPVRRTQLQRAIQGCLASGTNNLEHFESTSLDPKVTATIPSLHVLLVEDHEVNRKVAIRMLEKLGCNVEVAVNGQEAVEKTAQHPYDVVLMDCLMPEMDGYEATRMIREREQEMGGHQVIIAMTANALQGDREQCLTAGMDDYLTKPVKREQLLAKLKAWTTATKKPNMIPQDLEYLHSISEHNQEFELELIEEFLQNAEAIMLDLQKAFDECDELTFARLSLTLKESARSVGADAYLEVAARLELAGKQEKWDDVPDLLKELQQRWQQVRAWAHARTGKQAA